MKLSADTKNIVRRSWAISWPMAVVMFLEFLMGIIDVYIAGKFGKEIQAAYGVSFQLYFVFIIAALAITVGSVSVVSRLYTSGRKAQLNTAINSSLISAAAAGGLLLIIGFLFCGQIVRALNIPGHLKPYVISLLRIYSLGYLFEYLIISSNGILRSCELIKRSLITMSTACVLNIILNLWLSLGTPLRFKGIAVATVISLFAGSLLNIFFIRRLISKAFVFSMAMVKKIFNIGWPFGLLHILWQLGAMMLFIILGSLPKNNVEIMAAFTNGLRIEAAIFLPAIAFNLAGAALVGNLLGQHQDEEAAKAGLVTAGLGVALVTLLTLTVMLNARRIAAVLSGNEIVIAECVRYIYIALLAEPFMAWAVILGGALTGAGDTRTLLLIVGSCIWLVRIPLCYLFGLQLAFGAVAVWWCMNASMLLQSGLVSIRYFSKRWISHI